MSFRDIVILVFALLAVTLSAAGSALFSDSWWGLHFWEFLPRWAFLAGSVALLATLLLIVLRRPDERRPKSWRSPVPLVVIVAVFAIVSIAFRVRHLLLGDGIPIVETLPTGEAFHAREPLTFGLQAALFRLFTQGFPADSPESTAWRAVAAGSIAAGVVFIFVAWALAGEILRRWRKEEEGDDEPQADAPRLLLTALLVSQGYALLFFGYVENYTFLLVATGLFLFTGLRAARGAAPLWLPGLAAVLATTFHIMGAALFPAWAALLVFRLRARGPRIAIDAAVVGFALVAVELLLARLEPGYSWFSSILTVGRVTTISGIAGINTTYLGSPAHVRDFLNEHWLTGPLGLFFFLAALPGSIAYWLKPPRPGAENGAPARRAPTAGDLFLATNAVVWLVIVLRMADSNLGYARDWDLQCAAALGFTVAAFHLMPRPTAAHLLSDTRFLALALAVSLFHFVPWVAVNASASRSLARTASLPLGYGRPEGLVAKWHLREGDLRESWAWYHKSLDAYPESHAAWCGLGVIAFEMKEYDRAADYFRTAIKIRPQFVMYRRNLVNALIDAGKGEEAIVELEALLAVDPENAVEWRRYGDLLAEGGHSLEARTAYEKVLHLRPGDAEVARLIQQQNGPN